MAQVVDRDDLGWLLICTVRYSLGRRSTAPSTTASCVRAYARGVSPQDRATLTRDIYERGNGNWASRDYGDACDGQDWRELYEWLMALDRPKD